MLLQRVLNWYWVIHYILSRKVRGWRSIVTMALSCIISEINRDIGQKSRFFIPYLHSTPPLGGPRVNIAIQFGEEKLEWCGYPVVRVRGHSRSLEMTPFGILRNSSVVTVALSCRTSNPSLLSLAIPEWVGEMSTSVSCGVNRHTTWCANPYPHALCVSWCLTEG